jgi:hypothetical protein
LGFDGSSERAKIVRASLWSNINFIPSVLFIIAFRQRIHSDWIRSYRLSLPNKQKH